MYSTNILMIIIVLILLITSIFSIYKLLKTGPSGPSDPSYPSGPSGPSGPSDPSGPSGPTDKNSLVFENTSNKPIIVHLDVNKPPCGVGRTGACNPPEANGNCLKKEEAVVGTTDMDYGVEDCGYDIDAKDNGDIDKIWGNGPKLSGAHFYVIDKDGNKKETPIYPAQRLLPNEKWLLQLPISNDGSGKAVWCFRHAQKGELGSENMECSGVGAWFTPDNTENATSPLGVQRVEWNVNTKDEWKNWVLNFSAVDGINSNITADINNNSKSCLNFSCPTDLQKCPQDNKGTPTLSSKGHDIKYPSCIAPKLIGAPYYNTNQKDGICWSNGKSKMSDDQCCAAAGSGLATDKLNYHKSWDYTSNNIEPEAKKWNNFIRPNEPGNKDNCMTYTWAYDEQVCSLTDYSDNGKCKISGDTLFAVDNPYAPLGTCNVYSESEYQNPNIYIKINNVLDEWN